MKKEMTEETGMVNPLRNERVVVRHVPRETAMVHNPKHVLSGGMADGAVRYYSVPTLQSGRLVDVLTTSEKNFLEDIMGLEPNDLSIYKTGYTEDGVPKNYWKNPAHFVRLIKGDNYLDLSVPEDYIRYKILLANKDFIAPSLEALQNYPKATYEFVIMQENEEAKASSTRINATMEAYKEFGKIDKDADKLRLVIETINGTPMSSKTTLEVLNDKVDKCLQADPKIFLKVVKDPYIDTKILIRKGVEAGVIANRSGLYFLRDTGEPLCHDGDATLAVAAAYLNEPKNSETELFIEAKVNQYNTSK